jgi:hypothetical protein
VGYEKPISAVTPKRDVSMESRSLGVFWRRCCCLLLLVLPLGGCNRDNYFRLFGYDRAALLKKYTPQDDEALAIRYVDLLRQSQFEQIEDRLDPSIKNAVTRDALTGMSYTIPTGEPTSIKTVDSRVVNSRDGSTSCITLEYEFEPQATPIRGRTEVSGTWLIAQVVIQTKGSVKTIAGLHVSPSSRSFEEINEFTLADKGISQYAGLFLAIGAAAFSLYAFVLCIRTRMGKKKWIWLILILIGVFRLTVNWTTGEWSFTPLTVQVPPVITACSLYGACMLQIMVPGGAIAFLILRKKHKSEVPFSPIQSPTLDQ